MAEVKYNLGTLAKEEIYSLEEVKTNKVWIDGKPIYRKVIVSTFSISDGSSKAIPLNNNIETPISCTFISNNGGESLGVRNYGTIVDYFPTGLTIYTETGWALASGEHIIILEYTKATDV